MNLAATTPGTLGLDEPSRTTGPNSLGPDSFLRLLIAQLQTQDPLSPMDTQGMISQLATMEMVAESRAARQCQELTQAVALMGRTVYWNEPETGLLYSGAVTGVQRDGSEAYVLVGEVPLKLGEILAIS
jgi:flagellar basal-body rod modification protein FlgD